MSSNQQAIEAPPPPAPITVEQCNNFISSMTPNSALLCPFAAHFMTQPVVDGKVDAQWIADRKSNPFFLAQMPLIGTPLIRSVYGGMKFPASHLKPIKLVDGEKGLVEHFTMHIRKRDELLKLNEHKMLESGGKIKELTEQLAELKRQNEGYYSMIQSMSLGMKAIEEQRNAAVEQMEELRGRATEVEKELMEKLEKKEEELKIVRGSGKVLGEQVKIWKEEVEQVNMVNKELEIKNQSLLEALSVPRVPEESVTPPTFMKEDKENIPMIILVIDESKEVNEFLKLHGLRAIFKKDYSANGLSLFEAVSHQILQKYRRMKSPSELLTELLDYFKDPAIRLLFREQVKSTQNNEEPNWQQFLEFIKRGGVSDCIIDALAKCLRVHIKVFSLSGITDFQGTEWHSSAEHIKIAHFSGGHAPFYLSTEKIEFIQID